MEGIICCGLVLLLGVPLFLLMSVVTMVAHAQKSLDHTWPWWVFGIVSGISILVFFGMLERQSEKTREWLQQWRRWDN